MRIFSEINRDNLEAQQLFFVECWASMSHERCLDSDRVSYNNILNASTELLELYSFGDKHRATEKRRHVVDELNTYLKQDTVLCNPVFKNIPDLLKDILSTTHPEPVENQKGLMMSLLQELKQLLILHYREIAVEELRVLLANGAQSDETALESIFTKANALLSHLITLGMPTTETYPLCQNYLIKRQNETQFLDAFDQFSAKLTIPFSAYKVSLRFNHRPMYELLSKASVTTFGECQFSIIPQEDDARYHFVQVVVEVEAISHRAALIMAENSFLQALDLFSYFLGKHDIRPSHKVIVTDSTGATKEIRRSMIEMSNHTDRSNDLSIYMKVISHLCKNGSQKTANKINAAFRFYQNGQNEKSLESRFTAFWSALESLTLIDENGSHTHEQHVINAVVPCIALDYPVKQLFSLRGCAKILNWPPFQTAEGSFQFQSADLGQIYLAIKDTDVRDEVIRRLDGHPYAGFKFNKFMMLSRHPFELAQKIENHESKVELQIHRLYRVRNAIVHNASTDERLDLLVLNLEHYLRSTLNALVYTAHQSESITSPEEAFIRYQYQAKCIFSEMDPSRYIGQKKREGLQKSIEAGTKLVSDTKLIEWLRMHT